MVEGITETTLVMSIVRVHGHAKEQFTALSDIITDPTSVICLSWILREENPLHNS